MDPCHPDIKDPVYLTSKKFRSQGSFLGNRNIRSTGCADRHHTNLLHRMIHQHDDPCFRMVDQFRESLLQIDVLFRFYPGSHHIGTPFLKAVQNPFNLLRCLAFTVDGFSITVTKLSVMIQIGITQIFIRKLLQDLFCSGQLHFPVFYLFQKFFYLHNRQSTFFFDRVILSSFWGFNNLIFTHRYIFNRSLQQLLYKKTSLSAT